MQWNLKICELGYVSNHLKSVVSKNEQKISITFWDSVFLNLAQIYINIYNGPKISRISKKCISKIVLKLKFT